jgi:hypothetical protein
LSKNGLKRNLNGETANVGKYVLTRKQRKNREIRKTLIISGAFMGFHLIEDFLWVTLGRFTTLSIPIIVLAIVIMGLFGGMFFRIPKIKQFLGS